MLGSEPLQTGVCAGLAQKPDGNTGLDGGRYTGHALTAEYHAIGLPRVFQRCQCGVAPPALPVEERDGNRIAQQKIVMPGHHPTGAFAAQHGLAGPRFGGLEKGKVQRAPLKHSGKRSALIAGHLQFDQRVGMRELPDDPREYFFYSDRRARQA